MVTQTIQFESISLSEVGSGTITAFLYDEATLVTALASIEENSTLKGRYAGTVEDIPAETYRLVVKFNNITVNDANEMVDLLLEIGTYISYRGGDATAANQLRILSSIQSIVGNVAAAITSRGVSGFPRELRKGDAATVANGNAIYVRVYSIDDEEFTTPLMGSGSLLFDDADSIEFALTKMTEGVSETTPEVQFAISWVESGSDGYFLITYDETALDSCTSFSSAINSFHQWGIKVQWSPTSQPLTVASGFTKVLTAVVE